MKLEGNSFSISFDKENNTLYFKGSLRLGDLTEYNKIKQFMLDVYDLTSPALILDFTELNFMNSAGISTICRFIFEVKEAHKKPVSVIGNNEILWQKKSFINLKIIWDQIQVSFKNL